jgi:hypothetical protein
MQEALAGQSTSINTLNHLLHGDTVTLNSEEGLEEYVPLDIGRVPLMPGHVSFKSSERSSPAASVPILAKLAADSFLPPGQSTMSDLLLSQYVQDHDQQEGSWDASQNTVQEHQRLHHTTEHGRSHDLPALRGYDLNSASGVKFSSPVMKQGVEGESFRPLETGRFFLVFQ